MKLKMYQPVIALVIILILSAFSSQTKAQIQVFGLGGYLTSSKITVAEGELVFDDGVTYGLGFDFEVDRGFLAELSWSMASSKAELERYKGTTTTLSDLTIHHFQAGGIIEPQRKKKVSPFGMVTVGASLFYPAETTYEEHVLFSIALGLGLKVNMSEKVGLRFQGRLIIPMQFSGAGVWFGTGGAGVSVGAWSAFVQADITAGLFVRI